MAETGPRRHRMSPSSPRRRGPGGVDRSDVRRKTLGSRLRGNDRRECDLHAVRVTLVAPAPRPRTVEVRAQHRHAVEEARAGPVQQVAVGDEQIAVAHGGDARPAQPVVEPRRALAVVVAADDHVGLRREDRLDRDRRRRQRQRREHVVAAARRDRLRNEVAAADRVERLVPDFVEHAQLRRRSRIARPAPHAGARNSAAAGSRDRRRARERAELLDVVRDARDRLRIADEHRDVLRAQRGELRRRRVRPRDDEVRRERHDALQVERRRVAHARQRPRRRGPVAVRDDADHGAAGARGEQQFGRVRREADDALRRLAPASRRCPHRRSP